MPLPQWSLTPSQPGLKLSCVVSPENTRAHGCLSRGSPPPLSYLGFQFMAHPHAQTPVGRQTSHCLPASVSSELKASFCRESCIWSAYLQPSHLDPTPHFSPVKIYIHLSSQDSISAWSRAGPGKSELQGFLLLVRHVETRWTRLLGNFAFMLGGTWPSHTWLIKPGSLSLCTHRDPRLPLLFICGCSRWRRWGRI